MEKKNIGRIGLTLVIISLGIIHLFPFQKKIQAEIQNDHFIRATKPGMEPGFNRYPILAMSDKNNSGELIIYQRRIESLEKIVKDLTALNQSMLREMDRLNRLVEKSLVKKTHIAKVKRIGGRPHEKDTMVSVAGFLALWNQIDILMVKLDEIIAKFSP